MKKIFLLLLVLILSACGGKKIEGEYVGKDISLTFKPNGKLSISTLDASHNQASSFELDYKTDGNKVNVSAGPAGVLPITQNDDGSINAPAIWGGILIKK